MSFQMFIPQIGAADVLRSREVPTPQPGPNQVLIRNHAAAVNFIDTLIRRGEMPDYLMLELPHVPGVEGAGVVAAIGTEVTDIRVGDRVAWMGAVGAGGYGEHVIIDAPYVISLSPTQDLTRAASLPVNAMTAWHMLVNLGRVQKGDRVLIHAAAGGVGTMLVQIAKHLGLEIIASAGGAKHDYVRAQGADHVVDYRTEDLTARVKQITNDRGVNLTLNPLGGDTLTADLNRLAPNGTAILFGFLAGPPQGTFAEDLSAHFDRSIAVRVSDIYTHYTQNPKAFNADMAKVFNLLEQDILKPQIQTLPLTEAAEAHRQLEGGKTTGKLVLTLNPPKS